MTKAHDWSQEELFILAFDHRSSFLAGLLGIKGREPTREERETVSDYKNIIFQGFRAALEKGVPKEHAGILVDEEFGSKVLREAKDLGLIFAMPVEKSGQDEFDFEYGGKYEKHIEDYGPTFVKVLVRYNPEGEEEMNVRQLKRLRTLSEYLLSRKRPLLFELLVPATKAQLDSLGDRRRYDVEIRPRLMVGAMGEIQDAGVEPTVWKLEGVERREDAERLVEQARRGGRRASVVTLGRGESKEMVQRWVQVGAQTEGVNGFAVGRTIFWDPLSDYRKGKIDRNQAIRGVSANYLELVNFWSAKKRMRKSS
jgi:5-dehydro-2-deoxygluconokinase